MIQTKNQVDKQHMLETIKRSIIKINKSLSASFTGSITVLIARGTLLRGSMNHQKK